MHTINKVNSSLSSVDFLYAGRMNMSLISLSKQVGTMYVISGNKYIHHCS